MKVIGNYQVDTGTSMASPSGYFEVKATIQTAKECDALIEILRQWKAIFVRNEKKSEPKTGASK